MKGGGGEESNNSNKNGKNEVKKMKKPDFRPAKDDTKPLLQDPILRSDPIETEEALLRLPPFHRSKPTQLVNKSMENDGN